ncbi:lipoprotein-anchoring transpeptidase ErfK/SrfK [Mycobacterium sp. BK558]|uniref:Putative L,D-transpeptidase LppS n=1 Tax=Mycolicibacterium chlorophenolicum TaxID=37916 RepID=A0A0J6W5C3_9MYCO|nr:Ig-like domain-containing protein [Mycolicibacterium chlorophenolicum]KMO76812.1 putative L,D-transpeptidase LppS precursor [Mycolicibacterium chlorophenolicum]MBI5340003.1 L,D-transpeptidase family protein [Mycolicibacterium rufum]RZT18137.1 lipoprotein-anchoring transpeptidase ErfK/SrfK [Mycobacterium sp. BK558]
MSPANPVPSLNRRRALAALAVGVVAPGALAACMSTDKNSSSGQSAEDAPAAPQLRYEPEDAASDVAPTSRVAVTVENGWFQKISLSNTDGKPVAGALNRDRTEFTASEPLGYGVEYRWAGTVVGQDGKAVPVKASFTTVDPDTQVNGQFQLSDGQTVGVAAPIILQFDAAIADEDRAEVEKAVKVTTTPEVEGSWAWLPDEAGGSRMHWRTKEYYPPGTTVHVDAKLYGVPFGEGAYGASDSTLDFTIGRRQVVKAEASSHRIQVLDEAGAVIMDFPCSYGEGDEDRNVTRSGIHVVTEKYEDFYMSNPAGGYTNAHERFAVRISNNGEFIHANPNSAGAQGNSNVTNGCINLSTTDAEQYFQTAVYGDPVEVTGTRIDLSYADGDIWDWAVPWDEWTAMSALSSQKPSNMPESAPATPPGAPTSVSGRPGG